MYYSTIREILDGDLLVHKLWMHEYNVMLFRWNHLGNRNKRLYYSREETSHTFHWAYNFRRNIWPVQLWNLPGHISLFRFDKHAYMLLQRGFLPSNRSSYTLIMRILSSRYWTLPNVAGNDTVRKATSHRHHRTMFNSSTITKAVLFIATMTVHSAQLIDSTNTL